MRSNFEFSSKRDPKITSMFEVIGAHLVNIQFGHLFNESEHEARTSGSSITDIYKKKLKDYIRALKVNKDNYKAVLRGIHSCYQETTRFTAIGLIEFINEVINTFIPQEYINDMTDFDKDSCVGDIITRANIYLVIHILEHRILKRVIDNHNKDTLIDLQDKVIEFLDQIRDEYYEKFIQSQHKNVGETVPAETVKKMKNVITTLLAEKLKLGKLLESEKRKTIKYTKYIKEQARVMKEMRTAFITSITDIQQNDTSTKKLPKRKIVPQKVVTKKKKPIIVDLNSFVKELEEIPIVDFNEGDAILDDQMVKMEKCSKQCKTEGLTSLCSAEGLKQNKIEKKKSPHDNNITEKQIWTIEEEIEDEGEDEAEIENEESNEESADEEIEIEENEESDDNGENEESADEEIENEENEESDDNEDNEDNEENDDIDELMAV
ncbi:MAG: hypothetical protein KAS12_01545 [Candidatus Aenigmarchaeota archaeon]|nr:hypothetical protein [Candidatus Aenigmarchaeota archaeon]